MWWQTCGIWQKRSKSWAKMTHIWSVTRRVLIPLPPLTLRKHCLCSMYHRNNFLALRNFSFLKEHTPDQLVSSKIKQNDFYSMVLFAPVQIQQLCFNDELTYFIQREERRYGSPTILKKDLTWWKAEPWLCRQGLGWGWANVSGP